jgi:hypothetical protein
MVAAIATTFATTIVVNSRPEWRGTYPNKRRAFSVDCSESNELAELAGDWVAAERAPSSDQDYATPSPCLQRRRLGGLRRRFCFQGKAALAQRRSCLHGSPGSTCKFRVRAASMSNLSYSSGSTMMFDLRNPMKGVPGFQRCIWRAIASASVLAST